MAETTFEMTPSTLARAVANAAARERRRAAALLDDRADVELAKGRLDVAEAITEMAEAIRSRDAARPEPVVPGDLGDGDRDYHRAAEPELPEVHHMEDFAEGVALVQGGAHRRTVVGYNGANGHLRD